MNYSIKNDFLTVTVSDHGAELQSILGADGTEYLWQGDPTYWSDRAMNIFPYVARLTEGKYYMDNEVHEMLIHGIALYKDFNLICHEKEKMVFELLSNEETYTNYPRNFAFRVVYELEGNKLVMVYEVDNKDEKTMYFGLGGHPGFNVPLKEGLSFEDYKLTFSEEKEVIRVGFTPACFLNGQDEVYPLENGKDIPLRHDLFDDDAVVLREMPREVTLHSDKDSHSVTVSYPQMPFLGIWHMPHTNAPYVCIEPWCSLPATDGTITVFEEQKDLLKLPAGESYSNTWTVTIN